MVHVAITFDGAQHHVWENPNACQPFSFDQPLQNSFIGHLFSHSGVAAEVVAFTLYRRIAQQGSRAVSHSILAGN